jgi:hypothetical protein
MDSTTAMITTVVSICIVLFGIVAVVGSMYGILVWYPAQRKKKVDVLKASGKQGEATILRLPDHISRRSARAVFTLVPIGLEIRVMGLETYEVDKVFTIPSSAVRELQVGKVVPVWVDPKEPRNLDKIVIHLD